ncbi:hypothetical protein [Pseudonocardia aurantiaca]|uniref:DUF5753 domain-containing protein n=1 Tax=Pseudonocardia aurantiaca TaxID=75290 RepID=A0ABW4FRW0_9PSEU
MLPWSVDLPTVLVHSFVLYDDRLVLVEAINAELAIRSSDDVALYARPFEAFWDVAFQGEQASALIARVALDLPT